MKQVVTANSGRMVSSPGDFLLALFNTSRDALDAAVSFLQGDEPLPPFKKVRNDLTL